MSPIRSLAVLALVWILAGSSSIHNRLDAGHARQVDVALAAEMVRRIAPLLGLRPAVEPVNNAVLTLTSSN